MSKRILNIDPQRDFAKEVEVALENIIEMKSTMTKMMALLEKTSLDQRKPYNDTDSVRSLISQISLYSDMVQDIMPVIQEKDTEDPLCLLDRSSGRRASTISLIEEKSSSTLPSPPSFTAFYDESPNIMEEVNVSSIQVQKHKSYDKLNEKEDTNIKAEVSSKIDEKMKFFDNLSKIPLIRVSEDSLLPVSKQRQVFEREAMKAMFEEVSIQKQVPGKVSDSEFAPWVLPKNYGLSESLTHNPFIYNDPIHKRITKSAEDLSKCGLCHEEKIVNHLGISCSLCKKEQGLQSHSGNVINSVSMQNIAQSPIFIIKVQDAESQTFEDEFDNGNILYDNYSKLSDKLRKSSLISRGTNETIEKEKSSSRRYDSLKDSNAFPCEDLSEYDMGEEEFIRSNSSVLISSPHDTALPVETIEKAISPFSPHDFEESIYNNMNAVRRRSESNLKTKLFKLSVSMDDLDQTDSLTISFSGSNINISSSSQLLAKSNIDISSGEFGTHLTLRPNLKRSLSNTSSRLKDEIEIPESIHRNEDVRTVIEEELLEMKTETDYDEEEEDSGAETVIETKRPPSSNEYLKDRFEFDLPPSKLYYFDDDPLNSPPKELKVEDTYSLEESYIFGTKPERKSPSPIQSHSSEEIMIDQQSPSEMDDDMMEDKRADHEGASNETLSSLLDSVRVNENKFEINDRDFQNYEDDISQEWGGHKESDISNKESKLYKILFIGSSSAGKTSIIRRYVKHTFTPSYRATIGADFLSKVIHWDEAVTLRLQLWDIAGQDRFSLLSRSFYKDAVGAFIVCDISRPDTLDACIPWKEELDAKVQTSEGGKLPCFLLANKCDLVEDSTAQSKLTSKVCQMHGFHGWMQTSAKEDINITQAIEMLLRQIVKQDIDSTPFATDQESLVLENEGRKKKRSGCLC
ncbi:RAB32 [Lepeophtheirus salmonis]|uniref:RAB32 n=1 Tax=Lepeophtheirus salmonis TaxID=72036 RepID=A0A7R8H9G8_LEPSM|nr:RAB32 [Lepeophtheirus salmonis]CAF2941025.1 RAB32 [Lepeophtheirus salmonis]